MASAAAHHRKVPRDITFLVCAAELFWGLCIHTWWTFCTAFASWWYISFLSVLGVAFYFSTFLFKAAAEVVILRLGRGVIAAALVAFLFWRLLVYIRNIRQLDFPILCASMFVVALTVYAVGHVAAMDPDSARAKTSLDSAVHQIVAGPKNAIRGLAILLSMGCVALSGFLGMFLAWF